MMRSSVDFPEPDRPSNATISPLCSCRSMPSRTRNSSPAAPVKYLLTPEISSSTSPLVDAVMVDLLSNHGSQCIPPFGQGIESPPEQPVDTDHIDAHHQHADENPR